MSKDLISRMSANQVYDLSYDWAKQYDTELAEWMKKQEDYTKRIFNIERNTEKPRKDYAKWLDVKQFIQYFFDEGYEKDTAAGFTFAENIPSDEVKRIITGYMDIYDIHDDKDAWLDKIRAFCEALGYARDAKSFKKNPQDFKGHIGDVTGILRTALTNRKNSPDLHEMMQVMGLERVMSRYKKAIESI
jgi:glutamyl-tRNA synthetase